MKRTYFTLTTLQQMVKWSFFYLLNKHRYKLLEFKALIIDPLRIDGKKYISLHRRVVVKNQSWLIALKIDAHEPALILNEGCSIGDFNHIAAVRKVVIGKYVLTANRVYISDNLHQYEDIQVPVMHQAVRFKSEVHIGDGSWIGENACIMGVKIGKHCIIGANAVVTRDIPDYSVAVGIPAQVTKRFNVEKNTWEPNDSAVY